MNSIVLTLSPSLPLFYLCCSPSIPSSLLPLLLSIHPFLFLLFISPSLLLPPYLSPSVSLVVLIVLEGASHTLQQCVSVSVTLSVCPSVCDSVCMYVCLSDCLSVCLFECVSVSFPFPSLLFSSLLFSSLLFPSGHLQHCVTCPPPSHFVPSLTFPLPLHSP
jgi:hypothetical protein